jgi:hypothetical protein
MLNSQCRLEEGDSMKPLGAFVLVLGAAVAVSALAVEEPAPRKWNAFAAGSS